MKLNHILKVLQDVCQITRLYKICQSGRNRLKSNPHELIKSTLFCNPNRIKLYFLGEIIVNLDQRPRPVR